MQEYLNQVRHLQSGFKSFNLLRILRSRNTYADSLATLATSSAQSLLQVILVEDLCKPTKIKREMVHIHQIRVGPSWMDSIVLFLKEDILLEGSPRLTKCKERLIGFGCLKTKSCKSALFLGHICYTYILRHQTYSYRS